MPSTINSMNKGTSIWKIAAFLAILISVSGAFMYSECPQCGMTKLLVTKEDNTITASIFVTNYEYNKQTDSAAAAKQIQDIMAGKEGIDVAGLGFTVQNFSKGTFQTLKDAKLDFYYSGAAGNTPIPNCNPAYTKETLEYEYLDDSGATQTLTLYAAKCTIPEELFAGKCMDVSINFQGNAEAYPASTAITVCAKNNDLLNSLSGSANSPNSLANIIQSYSEDESGICLLTMVLFGLLVASMFYTGKNPLSLLDITTPKLPTPKGVGSSGSIVAPMSYSRMGSRLKETNKYMGKFFRQYNTNTNKYLTTQGRPDLAALIEREFKRTGRENEHHLKALAYRFAERSVAHGEPLDMAKLRQIFSLNPKDKANYGRNLREFLTDFQRRGGIDNTIGMLADLHEIGRMQSKFIARIGGESDSGKAPSDYLLKGATTLMTPLQRVPLVGLFVTSSIRNIFSSYHYSKRFVRSVAKIPGNVVSVILPDSVKSKLHEKAEKGGWTKAPVLKALDWYLTASSASGVHIGRHMQVLDKLSQSYTTWDEASYADVNTYLFRKLASRLHPGEEELTKNMNINQLRDLAGISHMVDRVANDREAMLRLRALESGEGMVRKKNVLTLHEIFTSTFEGVTKPEDIRLRRTLELLKTYVNEAAVSGKMTELQASILIDKIHGIINSSLSSHEKLTEISKLVENNHGALGLDQTRFDIIREVERIRTTETEDYKRALLLDEYILRYHENAKASGEGDFNLHVGRNSIYEEGTTTNTSAWSTYLFNEYTRNLEAGNGVRSLEGESLLSNVMKGTWVKLLNQMYGISRAELEMDPERKALMQIMERYLHEIYSGGDAVARKYGSAKVIPQYEKLAPYGYGAHTLAYSGNEKDAKRTLLQPLLCNAELAFSRDKSVKVVGNIAESKPQAGWWKIDMKQYWNFGPSEKNQISVSYISSKMFGVARYLPSLVEFEKRAFREGKEGTEKIKVYQAGFLERRLTSMVEEYRPNSLSHGAETMRYFKSVLAEYVRRYADVAEEAGAKKYPGLYESLKKLTNEQILEFIAKPTKGGNPGITAEFFEGMSKYLKQNINYDIYKKGVWAQTGDGSMAPVGVDTPLGDLDRVLNGVLVYRDNKEARWKKFNVEAADARKTIAGLSPELAKNYHELSQIKDSGAWTEFLNNVESSYHSKSLGAKEYITVLYNYSRTTGDWSRLNSRSDSIMFMNKDEYMKRGEMAYHEKWYGKLAHYAHITDVIDPGARIARRALWGIGVATEQFMLNMLGGTMRNLDAVNVISERYREHAQRVAWNIWGEEDVANKYLPRGTARALSNVSIALFRFIWAWETTVDRHPTGGSYALYKRFQERTLYHFGPESPFPIGMLVNSYFNPDQQLAMKLNNVAPVVARWVMRTPVTMFRNYKVSMMGQTTPYDLTGNPMDSFASTDERTIEGLRAIMNPWFAGAQGGFVMNYLRKLLPKYFHIGEELQRNMGGEEHRKGLGAGIEHFSDVWSIGIHARDLDANPNLSILGIRGSTDASVRTSEMLTQEQKYNPKTGANESVFGGFFEGDPYLARQASSNVIRRFGAAGLNELERESEMSHAGPWTRVSGWRYMNPVLLAWHFPVVGVKNITQKVQNLVGQSRGIGFSRAAAETMHGIGTQVVEGAKEAYVLMKPGTNLINFPLCPYCHQRVSGRGTACNNPRCARETMQKRWTNQLIDEDIKRKEKEAREAKKGK